MIFLKVSSLLHEDEQGYENLCFNMLPLTAPAVSPCAVTNLAVGTECAEQASREGGHPKLAP